jgi:hypothetical protein
MQATKQRILDTSALVAGVIDKHLSRRFTVRSAFSYCINSGYSDNVDDNVSLFTYYTVMLGLANILLVDGR